ncbi:MAG: archease [Nanoarchaeota archaeon]
MKPFEYFPHTADLKFRAYGETIEETFIHAAQALVNHMTSVEKVHPVIEKRVVLRAHTLESLLYDFLEEVLFILDVDNGFVSGGKEIRIKKQGDYWALECTFTFDYCKNYDHHGDVKAMTYNEMEIKHVADGTWMAQVVVDI